MMFTMTIEASFMNHLLKKFDEIVGKEITFVQDNCAYSKLGVLRGMHYQDTPYAQGKLISVIRGEIYDVALVEKNLKIMENGQRIFI